MTHPEKTFPLALVTGAAHRLGKVFAMTLASQGFGIVLHYNHSREKSDETADEIRALGVPVHPFRADLKVEAEINSMFAFVDDLSRGENALKVLVNSAAVMTRGDVRDTPLAEFNDALALNLMAPYYCAQLAYQRMPPGGLIVNISDVAGQKTWKGYPAYSVSKAGLDSLTKILARAFGPKVRVNAIAPGLVLPASDFDPERWQQMINRTPARRPASPMELGQTLEFLLKNEYITGQIILVDGGYSLI